MENIRKITTETGTTYLIEGFSQHGILRAVRYCKSKLPTETKVIAIYPDRLESVKAAVRWEKTDDGRMAGFNEEGVRTCLLVTTQVRTGMILVNPKNGLQSTRIVKIL